MSICIEQYRITIGLFNRCRVVKCKIDLYSISIIVWLSTNLYYVLLIYMLLVVCGDVEVNPGPRGNVLKICHINIQRFTELKLTEIKNSIAGYYDIIAFTETFFNTDTTLDLSIPGYQPIIRRDRDGIGGGGVAVYVSNCLGVKRREDLEGDSIEALWAEISCTNHRFLLCVCYRPPKMQMHFWDDLQNMVDLAKIGMVKSIVIAGDLNSDENTQPRNHNALMRFANSNSLCVHVDKPTRVTQTTSSVLDQFLSNIPDFVSEVQVSDAPLLTNDHLSIFMTLHFKVHKEKAYDGLVWL